ncbi:nitroreductase family protein [Guggenheimella bovis]
MNKLETIINKKSCRDYQKSPITGTQLANVKSLIKNITDVAPEVDFAVITEGEYASPKLEGIAGYNGVMIKAPHYIALLTSESEEAIRKGGYYTEKLLFELMELELGSVWIHVIDPEKVKAQLGIESEKTVRAIIAFGKPEEPSFIEKFFQGLRANKGSVYSEGGYGNLEIEKDDRVSRKETSSFVYLDEWGKETTYDELEARGLGEAYSYMKHAPSFANRQPWKFLIKDHAMYLAIEKNESEDRVSENLEAGIAMYYFKLAMNEMGLVGNWEMKAEGVQIPDNYALVGTYALH